MSVWTVGVAAAAVWSFWGPPTLAVEIDESERHTMFTASMGNFTDIGLNPNRFDSRDSWVEVAERLQSALAKQAPKGNYRVYIAPRLAKSKVTENPPRRPDEVHLEDGANIIPPIGEYLRFMEGVLHVRIRVTSKAILVDKD